jgi:HD-like signal output (HDOD) protein
MMSTQTGVETISQRAVLLGDLETWPAMRALPTLPSVLFRFLGLIGDPKVGTDELANFIWKDPALLARALPMATSNWNRIETPETSLRDGIAALSRERIRNIAFTTPLLRSFEPVGTGSHAIIFWERSLLCATSCQAVASHLNLASPDRYYVAGLMHDIGYLILLQKRPTIFPTILQQWAARPAHLLEIENELLGIDHCRLGLQAAARLGLESWIYPAIGTHHTPTRESEPISRITAIGAAFANSQGVDFFPRRSLSRATREREMHEIIGGLLPELAEQDRTHLLEAMERSVRPIRSAIRDLIVDSQVAGETRIQPHFTRPVASLAALPATA